MDVLYYLFSFPKLSESFVLNEIVELERRGHNVAVFAIEEPEEEVVHEEFEEVDVPVRYAELPGYSDFTDLLSRETLHPRVLRRGIAELKHPLRLSLQLHLGKQCARFMDEMELDFDVLHGHFSILTKMGMVRAAAYHDVPCTVTTHAYDLYTDESYPEVMRQADRVVTISEYNRSFIEDELGISTPVDVVRAGIYPEKFQPSENCVEERLLSVARFSEKKGLKYAIEAVAGAVETHPNLEYHIIGSGELEDELRSKIDELGLQENVNILGNVSDERLIRELDEAQVFLLPSVVAENGDRDGIPVSLMEAMAMKTVPISTKVSGIPELIDNGVDGLLAEPRDASMLTEMVETLLENPGDCSRMAENSRQKVETKFNIRIEAEKLVEAFRLSRRDGK